MPNKLILLDLDGTVLDSSSTVARCYRKSFCKIGIEISEKNFEKRFFGKSFDEISQILVISRENQALVRREKDKLLETHINEIPIKRSTLDIVKSKMAEDTILLAATHASNKTASIYARYLKDSVTFTDFLTPEVFPFLKSSKEYYFEVANKYKTDLRNILLIDDDISNIHAAQRAGCQIEFIH